MTLRGNGCCQCRGPTVLPRQRVHLIFHGWCAKSAASLAGRAWNLRRHQVKFLRRAWRVLVARLQLWVQRQRSIQKIKLVQFLAARLAPPRQRCNLVPRSCPAYLCSPRDHFLQPWPMKSSRSPFPLKFSHTMRWVSQVSLQGCFYTANQTPIVAKSSTFRWTAKFLNLKFYFVAPCGPSIQAGYTAQSIFSVQFCISSTPKGITS